jgi:cysteine desulfuration protein SufE
LRVYSGRSAKDIVDTPPRFVESIGLQKHLSPTRNNGLSAMFKTIQNYAQQKLQH